MAGSMERVLLLKQPKRFELLEREARQFALIYSGGAIIRDNIFSVIENYARKKEFPIEIMKYPFSDEELCAFTFLKGGTVFLCVNTELQMCKQIFAAAHELYHIYCFGEDADQNIIRNGSLLKGSNVDDTGDNLEESEANAFAGLLLMPKEDVLRQIEAMSIDAGRIKTEDLLRLMDVFAVPYKACVLRLFECGILSSARMKDLYGRKWDSVISKIRITGISKRWQLTGNGTEQFGSLIENFSFNVNHEFLTPERKRSDRAFISSLRKKYNLDVEE